MSAPYIPKKWRRVTSRPSAGRVANYSHALPCLRHATFLGPCWTTIPFLLLTIRLGVGSLLIFSSLRRSLAATCFRPRQDLGPDRSPSQIARPPQFSLPLPFFGRTWGRRSLPTLSSLLALTEQILGLKGRALRIQEVHHLLVSASCGECKWF